MTEKPTSSEPDFEWEICRENIRPLRSGRRMAAIKDALACPSTSKNVPERVKNHFEEVMLTAQNHEDPLELCLNFIIWFEESFPFGRQKIFYEYLWKIVTKYATEERYLDDDRMLKIWDKMAENSLGNGWKVFQHANTIGSLKTSAVFYVRWAKAFEYAGNITEARKVYQRARAMCAAPISLLNDEENAMEMRELRRVTAENINDSWQQDEDDMVIEEDDKRVALTRLQGFGEHKLAPVVRLPHLVGDGGSNRLKNDKNCSTTRGGVGNGFQVFAEKEDEMERDFLQAVYEMDTHIEHIHLTDRDEEGPKESVLRKVPIKPSTAPPVSGFTIYDESAEENIINTAPAKPRLMLQKAMRDRSGEEVRAQKYLLEQGIVDEKIYE